MKRGVVWYQNLPTCVHCDNTKGTDNIKQNVYPEFLPYKM